MYVTEEQPYDTFFDHDCGFTYSLEKQIHSIAASSQAERYFTTLSLSATGSALTQVKFQIGTAATCNTMSLNILRSLLPDAELTWSPYRLYPYGNSTLLEPEGQVDPVHRIPLGSLSKDDGYGNENISPKYNLALSQVFRD